MTQDSGSSGNTNNLPKQILIIDDDSTVGQSVEGPLASYQISVFNSQDLDTAFYHFNNQNFDVVLVELEFGPLPGLALIQKFRCSENLDKRATSFVLMSGKNRSTQDENLLKELLDVQVIAKPFNLVQILPYLSRGVAVKQRLYKYEVFRQNLINMVKSGQLNEAAEIVKKNLPNLGQRGVALGCELYEIARQFDQGLGFIKPFAEKDRHIQLFQYLHGRFLTLLEKFEDARPYVEEAYKSAPDHLQRLADLNRIYLEVDQPEAAVIAMKRLLALSPENKNIKFEMFRMLHDRGYSEIALKFCKETTAPMDVVRYYNNRGVELSKAGDIDVAIKEYELALKFFPTYRENYRIHYNIALALVKRKTRESFESAAENLRRCLKLNPEFDKAKRTLESIEKSLANNKEFLEIA